MFMIKPIRGHKQTLISRIVILQEKKLRQFIDILFISFKISTAPKKHVFAGKERGGSGKGVFNEK